MTRCIAGTTVVLAVSLLVACDGGESQQAGVPAQPPASASSQSTPPAATPKAAATKPKVEVEPYSLKGDEVGMRLSDFKRKYRRAVDNRYAPFCSDENPGQKMATLMTESWHAAANIVSCTTVLPFEWVADESTRTTVASIKAKMIVYQFIDGFLYRIVVLLPPDEYDTVRRGLETKWGPPTSEGTNLLQKIVIWTNDVSSIRLVEAATHLLDGSMLLYADIELDDVAMEREQDASADDL